MTDIPRIPPQRAKAALVAGLREMADAIEAEKVQWVAAVALYTPAGSRERNRAFDQLSGFPVEADCEIWMMPLGVLRSAYLDFEDQLIEFGAQTLKETRTYTT